MKIPCYRESLLRAGSFLKCYKLQQATLSMSMHSEGIPYAKSCLVSPVEYRRVSVLYCLI
ncbi:hypothetical protein BDV35DRAFT_361108 [Aspergillus flavus]|uniref:Uncharacterized protein n=1 Tax=Aspergillus flavus TaxID=5059 RepID=A0A5N6GU91_ASPFL|nr:hypothetical protein BDV35DRAFT_361108 [Aspergillus flavus]